MAVSEILASIDREIAQLQQVRALLAGGAASKTRRAPGRPKKSATAVKAVAAKSAAKKRKLSPEGRKRIAEAAKRRWAAQRKAAAGK